MNEVDSTIAVPTVDAITLTVGHDLIVITASAGFALVNLVNLVHVLFGFWLTARCPEERKKVGVKVFSMLLQSKNRPPRCYWPIKRVHKKVENRQKDNNAGGNNFKLPTTQNRNASP